MLGNFINLPMISKISCVGINGLAPRNKAIYGKALGSICPIDNQIAFAGWYIYRIENAFGKKGFNTTSNAASRA